MVAYRETQFRWVWQESTRIYGITPEFLRKIQPSIGLVDLDCIIFFHETIICEKAVQVDIVWV